MSRSLTPRLVAGLPLAVIVLLAAAQDASAIVRGRAAGAIARHVVRVVIPNGWCTGTVVGRAVIVTAAHCVADGNAHVEAAGRRIAILSHSGAGDDAALVRLAEPLPASLAPIRMGQAGTAAADGSYIIAGYGVAQEGSRPRAASLREAALVSGPGPYGSGALMDPRAAGGTGASACLGDSGGPVVRRDAQGYVLVGVITKASRYSPTHACGQFTHYTAVTGGFAGDGAVTTAETHATGRPHHAKPKPRRKPKKPRS